MTARLLCVALAAGLAACTPDRPASDTPDATPTPADAASVQTVIPPERLAAALPERVGGVARTSVTAEQDSAMGLTVSRAEAVYGAGPGAVTVLVVDVGSAAGVTLMGLDAEPNATLDGRPVRRSGESSEARVQMRVGGRVFVEARGPADALDAYVRAVDRAALPRADALAGER